ncbi:MAG: hypothetical protein QME12_02740 [Nanoarchaeota archaeon]|nr:hypothetical protein [Nanoarchaeota archaeon]
MIPQDVRAAVHADEGTLFSVMGMEDTIILKKIETQTKEEFFRDLDRFAKEQTKRLKAGGFKEEDLWKAVDRGRARRRPKP